MAFLKLSNTLFNHEGEVATPHNVVSDIHSPVSPTDDSALLVCDETCTQYLKPESDGPHEHRRRASSMNGGGVPLNLRPVVSTNGALE